MPDDEITDAQRWQFQTESQRNIFGAIHLLQLLATGKGTKKDYLTMIDRVIRSARAAGHTKV